MTETSENKQYDNSDAIAFFMMEAKGKNRPATADSYRKAVSSLRSQISDRKLHFNDFTEKFLSEWLTALFQNGYSHNVACYYFKIIAALYNKAVSQDIAPPTDSFRHLAARLESLSQYDFSAKQRDADYTRLIALARASRPPDGTAAIYADIFLASILSGAQISPVDIARLKKADISGLPAAMRPIASKHAAPQRRYVFNLNQPHKTKRQLTNEIDAAMTHLMRHYGFHGTPAELPANLWAYAALKCGYTPSAIIGCLGMRPVANPIFALCESQQLSSEDADTIRTGVARIIMTDPHEWFVMRLRPSVRFKMLQERLDTLKNETPLPQLFYPSEEIAIRIGRKLTHRNRPLLPDIVFFRCRRSQVRPLFRRIGDIAWCYVSGRTNTGAYAAVSDSEMQRFQQAIGQFTPEYELYPAGTLIPAEGESVVIIGGLFTGRQGEIEKIISGENQSVIYRIVFPDNQGIEWRVNVDRRLVRKADAPPLSAPNQRQAYNQTHA